MSVLSDGSEAADSSEMVKALAVAVGVAVAGLVVGGGLVLLASLVLLVLGADLGLVGALAVAAVLSQVGFAATAIAYVGLTGRGLAYLRARVPTGRDLLWIVGAYLLALVAAIAGAVLATLTSAPTASNQAAEMGVEQPEALLLLIPISLLFIGPGEELLFRGTIQNRLREAYGPLVAVVVASALFAALHVVALTGGLSGRLVSIGLLFLPSLVLGFAYERTRNLVVTAVVHGAYDATIFGLLYVSVQYAPSMG